MNTKMKMRMLSLLLCFVMLVGLMPTTAFARTIVSVDSGNSLNMSISDTGILDWDDVSGATGYHVALTKPNLTALYDWDVANSYLQIISEMDGYKLDSDTYTIIVTAKGVSGVGDSMSYFYTSHVDKLEAPSNLRWNGNTAEWGAVAGASSYRVTLYNLSGLVATVYANSTSYDFSGNSPEDGWTFKVQAISPGTLSDKRNSFYTESPAKETLYNIGAYVYDATNGTEGAGGNVSVTTDKGTDGMSDTGYIKTASKGSTVTLNAEPLAGYEFVEWRQGTAGATVSTNASYSFTAAEHKYLYAVFQEAANVPTYTVSFAANGGTGTMADVTGLTGTYTLPANGFIAPANKQFKGWSLTSDGAIITAVEMTTDRTIYASRSTQNDPIHL